MILSIFGIVLRKRPLFESVLFGDLLVDQVDFYVQNRYTPRKSTCHLKIDGLKMKFPVEIVPFQGFCLVLGRVSDLCKLLKSSSDITSGCQK